MPNSMKDKSKGDVISPTTPLSDLPTPTADIPPTIINPSFEQKDNPLSRTIHALLRLFRKQSKPDSDKKEKPPVTTHNTYGDNIHGQNITINNGMSKEQMEELKKLIESIQKPVNMTFTGNNNNITINSNIHENKEAENRGYPNKRDTSY
ncbi:hypothetical protein EZS27_013551 [termite gut metagenome]|uniref:Uncharacterized protein n=1 Tax=termite gut metagenome TaxID=433724 RepID=A0A5J4RZK3_9ZZZZ